MSEQILKYQSSFSPVMEDWTEKYRPKRLDDIIGNNRALAALRNWAESWNIGSIPKKRAVILSGKPGTGKTSSALALAQEYGWSVVELNASDARNAGVIKKVATSGALNETFDSQGRFLSSRKGGRKLIILDEADNLYERIDRSGAGDAGDFSDRGGKKAIIDTIKITSQPIILIVNDYYGLIKGMGDVFTHLCNTIRFYEVNTGDIVELLKRICREENITTDLKVLQILAERCKGDVRSAVNDLQSIGLNRRQIDLQSLDVLGYRDREKIIFDAVRDVLKKRSLQVTRDNYMVDMEPETFLLWIAENLPREYQSFDDLLSGYEALSKADVFFGRVSRRQYYGLWSYANDFMNGGVSLSKTHTYGYVQYSAPTWMKEMKQHRSLRENRKTTCEKISRLCHISGKKSKDFMLQFFTSLFRENIRFACAMKQRLDLSESEILFLLGEKHAYKAKDILGYCEKTDEKQTEIDTIVVPQKKEEEEKIVMKSETKQPSLFDF